MENDVTTERKISAADPVKILKPGEKDIDQLPVTIDNAPGIKESNTNQGMVSAMV